MLLSIIAPADNDRGPQFMERVFSSICQSLHRNDTITLEYGQRGETVGVFVRLPDHLEHLVLDHLQAKYPNCTIEVLPDDALSAAGRDLVAWHATLRLEPELYPILRHKQFVDLTDGSLEDPLESVLGVLKPREHIHQHIAITIRPACRWRRWWATAAMKRLDRPFFRSHFTLGRFYARHIMRPYTWIFATLLGIAAQPGRDGRTPTDVTASLHGEREDDVQAIADKVGGNLFEVSIQLSVSAQAGAGDQAIERLKVMQGAFGAFTKSRLATFTMTPPSQRRRRSPRFFLSHEELATLFHPTTQRMRADRVAVTPYALLEAPVALPSGAENGGVTLGNVNYKSDDRTFGMQRTDRRQHLYIVGKTGMGKTTLMQNLIQSDIERGHGVCVIDPHGDLFESILQAIPKARTNDVVVFDPCDAEAAVSFNPLACPDSEQQDLTASDVVSSLKKLYDSWGPRLEDTLRNATYTAVEQGGTFHTIMRILTDEQYRDGVTASVVDPIAREFWQHEFAGWNDRYRTEAVAAIQNKLRPFMMNRSVRAIIGQEGKSLNLRRIMDEGKVLIVNLSKGRLGEDNSRLLGSLLVTKLQLAAMSRADVPEQERRDFYVYVDEFQNFTTGSFETILSEGRKYRLNLTMAHQYIAQFESQPGVLKAVFGNVGSLVTFQVGTEDAHVLAPELSKFAGQVTPVDITNLPKYHAYVRLLCDGMPQQPFSMSTLPPTDAVEDRSAVVRRASNKRYARPKDRVLANIGQQKAGAGISVQMASFCGDRVAVPPSTVV